MENNKAQYKPESGRSRRFTILFLVLFFIVCMGASFYVSRYVLVVIPIEGVSMEPTVHDGDKVLVYRTKKIKYNDVIIFENVALQKQLIKRVVGLEGDKIDIIYSEGDGCYHVYRNGEMVDESHIKAPMTNYSPMSLVVKEGEIFFLGDNRNISLDSHADSSILGKISEVRGKVLLRFKNFDISTVHNKSEF